MTEEQFEKEVKERERQIKTAEASGFEAWIQRREVKLMISLLPPAENQDVLPSLLRSAFEVGSSVGQGVVLHQLVRHMSGR